MDKIGSRPNEAGSYSKEDTAWEAGPESDMSIPGGAGAIVSTSGDLIQFIDALFKNKLLQSASLKRMTTFKGEYGLGIIKSPFYQRYTLGHNGHIDDFVSDVTYSPDDSMEMVILSNGSQLHLNRTVVAVLKISNNMSYRIPSFQLYRISTEKLPGYEGLYAAKGDPMKIEVKLDAHTLYARATGQGAFPLEPTSADTFGFEDAGITMQFHRATDGTVHGFDILQHGHKETYERE